MPAPTSQNWFKRYGMIILIFVASLQSLTYHPSIYYDYVDLFSYYTNASSLNTTNTFAEEDTLQPATSSEEVNATKWNAAATNKTDQMHPLHPATVGAINKPKPNVTLTFKKRRFDRMGSRTQLPFSAWLVARYHGWGFCSPPDPMARALGFPMCMSGYESLKMLQAGPRVMYTDDNITENGVYSINRKSNTLWNTIANHEHKNASMFTEGADGAVEEWRRMILNAPLQHKMNQKLWRHVGSVRIVAHVRRGDILPGVRNDVWISDEHVISLIEVAIYYVRQKRGPDVKIEVHVFSEDYGMTNWTKYKPLVDVFHLAPEGSDDMELNLRDWKHFVIADVLIVGGTFSSVPAYARRNPTVNGLPITIVKNRGLVRKEWIHWSGRENMIIKFPNETITAKLNAEDSDTLHNDNTTLLPIKSIIGSQYVLS